MFRSRILVALVSMLVVAASGTVEATGPTLSVDSISMPPGANATVTVSGSIAGDSTFGVNILLELIPQAGTSGTLEFTAEPPVDITQAGDPWPGSGTFSTFDTASTGSTTLNGSVDDNGTFQNNPVTYTGPLSNFPVIASAGASGVWDVVLSTSFGDSNWEGLTTKLLAGTVTVAAGSCSIDAHCDDAVACTDDTCVASSCVFTPNDANCTDDGVFCNGQEICDAVNDCVSSGDPCQAGEFCNETTDNCDACVVNADCDDGVFCNGAETCVAGACQAGTDPCPGQTCIEATDTCVDCTLDAECDDANVCTDDACVAGACQHTNNSVSCDDGSACTTNDTCAAGSCVGGAPPNCDDSNVCTDDSCDPATGCVNTNNTAACDDGSACTTNDTCAAGSCVGGASPNCDDSNVCTDDSCDPATGCVNTNNTAACDDGSACTTNDTCAAGSCVGGAPPNCDDSNVCTDDSCDPATGCVNTNNTAACNDGSACTTNDTCAAGSCVGGAPPNCDDSNVCTDDSCDPATGCVNTNNTAACDDGSACTTNDTCAAGACIGGAAPDCDDGNVCTDDSCDPATGCVNANNTASCSDGLFCNGAEVCSGGSCQAGSDPCPGQMCNETTDTCADCLANIDCNDGNPCTDDVCNAGACEYTNNTASCNDGSACTTNDTCAAGSCVGGAPPNCDDGNVCTDDSCDPATGCVNTNNTAACDDGDACTTNDTCAAGSCVGGAPPDCDDGNVCTDDSCDPATGCVNTDNTAACDDGSACTTNDTCAAGSCVGGPPPNCDDGNVCTDDSCDPATGCVNADNTAACDDGSACTTNDTCAAGSCVGGPPPNCDDGNVCTDDSCDPATGCVNTNNNAACDDGSACTTNDTCAAGSCVGGAPPNCDDGNVCTDDSCDPATGCVNTDNTAACDDGSACTTNDTCAAGSCVGGTPPNCDDGNVCTDDSCDPATGCVNTNNTASCDDGQFCTATDTCSGGSCVGSGATCPILCDESADTCVECFIDADCNDAVGCTDDTCVAGTCVFTANNANCPDDGLFCNGTEFCDAVNDCSSTGDPCPVGEFCNDSADQCLECLVAANCDDGIPCTDDACINNACINTPNDANCADDGLFCNGPEVCDAVNDCVSAGDPCQAGELCDESTDSCGQCLVDADCDDSVGCTDDSCVAGACVNAANNANCPDDGLFCTGTESCDATLDCISSGSPCQAGEICNDAVDQCLECEIGADCDDGVPCTDNTCVNGSCVYVPNNSNCSDDGLFCNGPEVCDAVNGCVSSGDPCQAGELCDEATDSCGECLVNTDCSDGVACTDDTCVAGACVFTANDLNCADDGLFCNGTEVCDAINGCTSTGDPCQAGELCDETTDTCGECLNNSDCDDGIACTDDSCVGGACIYTPNDANCPDDGLFCNGPEVCDAVNGCVSAGDPCQAGELCNEGNDSCGECLVDADCNDSVGCTDDACVAGTCVNQVNNANCPDDGLFCNGTESCNAVLDCISSGDPCQAGEICDEVVDTCGECINDVDCDDGVACTIDSCVANSCVFTPNDANCPDDGQFCNGDEVCDAVAGCVSTGDPCPVGEFCNEVTNTCGDCLVNADCDDGVGCTDDICQAGGCVYTPNNANCTDDGLYCNGPEVCDLKADCMSSGNPCGAGELCDESTDSCGECLGDNDCDDGLFCNGNESCVAGSCQAGSDPCPGQMCDEVNNVCAECLIDSDCDDANDCTANQCNSGVCEYPNLPNGAVCNGAPNGDCDLQDTCTSGTCVDNVRAFGTTCRSAANECDVEETCDGALPTCPPDDSIPNGTNCTDDGNDCTDDFCQGGSCTHPAVSDGSTCGTAPSGDCDLQDTCVSGTCTDNVRAQGTVCRAAANECDVSESCDGTLPSCPFDDFQQAGTVCTDDLNECSNDVCDGTGTCIHPPVTNGTVCGADPVGDCDAQDTCQSGTCTDHVQPDTFVCRPAAGDCDVDDSCDGVTKSCPNNDFQPVGTECADDGNECTFDTCDGIGNCDHAPVPNGTTCATDSNECTADVCVSGSCLHPALSTGTVCGDPSDTICDNPDSCDGQGNCTNNAEPAGVTCGDATDTECDNPDSCDGQGACGSNAEPVGTPCGDPSDSECDLSDSCDGVGECQPNILPQGAACGDPTDTFCTDPDSCDGSGTCESNDFLCPPGQFCFNSQSGAACVECTNAAQCDDGIFCNGAEVCTNFFCESPGDPCDDSNPCTQDSCEEALSSCLHTNDDNVDPDDGVFCNGVDFCQNGVLVIPGPEDCDDDNECTLGTCDVGLDSCVFQNVSGDCDDEDPCTTNDVCVTGVCIGESLGGDGEINLGFIPSSPIVPEGEILQIGLTAFSADQTDAFANTFNVILSWDPTKLELLGKVDDGPYTWQLSAFLDDSNDDGLNNSFTDGDALYTAWALPNDLPDIPMSGLLMTTLEFQTLEPVAETILEIPQCIGDTPTVTLIDAGPFGNLTGLLFDATIRIAECDFDAECDNGFFCDGQESCVAGVCTDGTPPCTDSNICTDDVCTESSDSCQNLPLTGDFDQDGIFCNGVDRCENGIFVPGSPPNCDDGNVCTDDSCSEQLASCVNAPNTGSCDDDNGCTINDNCVDGMCVGDLNPDCTQCENASECDDGIDCTDDSCHPAGFCENIPDDDFCPDDGLFCTGQEICSATKGDPVTGCLSTGLPCPECDEVNGCPCNTPLFEAAGPRYLTLIPQSGGQPVPTAFVLSYCSGSIEKYVGPLAGETTAIPWDNNNDGTVDGTIARLVDDPADALYLTPAGWGTILYVISEDITPDRLYEARADCGPQGSPNLTPPAFATTWAWADLNNNGVTNFDDIQLVVLAFQGEFNPDPGPQTLANLDVAGCLPSQSINFADIQRVVQAFQNRPYEEENGACVEPCAGP